VAGEVRPGRWQQAGGRLVMSLVACVAVVLVSAVATHAVTGLMHTNRTAARIATSSGPVTISNSKAGTPIVSAANLQPGSQSTGTVEIGNTSAVPVALRLAQDPVRDTPGPGGGRLSSALTLRIEQLGSSAPGSLVYSGPLTGLTSLPVGTLDPSERRTYRFTVAWPDGGTSSGDNAFQGSSVSLGYHWAGINGFSSVEPTLKPKLQIVQTTTAAGGLHALDQGVAVEVTCPAACDVTAQMLMGRTLAQRLGIPVDQVVAARAGRPATASAAPARYVVVGTATVHLKAAGRARVTVRLRPDVQRRLRGRHAIHLLLRSQLFDLSGQLQASLTRPITFTGDVNKRPARGTTPATPGTGRPPSGGAHGAAPRPSGAPHPAHRNLPGSTPAHRNGPHRRPSPASSPVPAEGFWAVWWHDALAAVILAALASAGRSLLARRQRRRGRDERD
jgi:hypothetical protein